MDVSTRSSLGMLFIYIIYVYFLSFGLHVISASDEMIMIWYLRD